MARLLVQLLMLAALSGFASQGDAAGAKSQPKHVGQSRDVGSMNGVLFRSWNDSLDNFAAPAELLTIEFRAVNTAPARKCYRWALFTTHAVPGRDVGQSPGWVEIGPAPHRGESVESDVGAWLQWKTTSSGQYPPVHQLFSALNVPERGTCQSYDGIYDLDMSTQSWRVDTDKLVALAGVDESGWPQLHRLLGDSVELPRPDGSWQHISELAAYHTDKTLSREYRFIRVEAEAGRDRAMYSLGLMYAQGNGVRQDANEAIKWFRRAADQGNAGAQYIMGAEMNRKTITPDASEARRWLRKAADQGEVHAQLELGSMYANGQGGRQDDVSAYMWLTLAGAGLPESEAEPRKLAVTTLAAVAARMTPSQVIDAQALAAKWRPNHWPSRYSDSMPTWTRIPYDKPGSQLDLDSSSITQSGDLRAAWTRETFDSPQELVRGSIYGIRENVFWIFDCRENTSTMGLRSYELTNGRTTQVNGQPDASIFADPVRWSELTRVTPGTPLAAIFTTVCSHPAER